MYKCDLCEATLTNQKQLKLHIKSEHSRCKSSQCCEENFSFDEYPCYYCEDLITCKNDLMLHKNCFAVSRNLPNQTLTVEEVNSFPCDQCTLVCISMEDLLVHVKSLHSEDQDRSLIFWCDMCPLYFESEFNLQFHKRGYHWE